MLQYFCGRALGSLGGHWPLYHVGTRVLLTELGMVGPQRSLSPCSWVPGPHARAEPTKACSSQFSTSCQEAGAFAATLSSAPQGWGGQLLPARALGFRRQPIRLEQTVPRKSPHSCRGITRFHPDSHWLNTKTLLL